MKKSLIFPILLFAQIVSAQNPGDTLFNSSHIHTINITFTQLNYWDSLLYYKRHADSFNLSTQALMGTFIIDGAQIDSVGISLKGNSSFGYPGQKKPIKLKFNEYVSGKKLEGLTTINLNNNVLDPTMMREKLLLDFMNKKGLPAPRCTYAKVFYNSQYVGLYKIIESVDKQFCQTHFNDWGGNLFKGDPNGTLGWLGNVPSTYYPDYELHSNNTANDWTDLVNLADKINNTPSPTFLDSVEAHLNTFPFIGQWAARNLFADLDGYFHAAHNYYLYHNLTTNKFEWATWDVSVCFGFYPYWQGDSTEKFSIMMANFPLVQRMLADPIGKYTYLNTICDYLSYFDTTNLSPIIDSLAAKIYPAYVAEPDSNQMFPDQMFYYTLDTFNINTTIGRIPALKSFITHRRAHVIAELNAMGWTCPLTSVHEVAKDNMVVSIYPNPSSGIINVKVMVKGELRIYNSLGQEIRKQKLEEGNNSIDISSQAQGFYFVEVRQGNNSWRGKVVKE